ncbi:tRNA methyltransferase complex subunit Cpd1 [Armillaria novae-zelandiae]|uniref:tRNA (adenine(58)-N(1))-methyltransferase catalytic subunit TRM61 n=1 Tax=Armillaria novae-zelandiae TaxID=153914 RepID=A0AA39UHJ4_9AGAR|nr:tRNA methyltransferase complex subunit Cpd1 [Armillaria novae-zelandiae]
MWSTARTISAGDIVIVWLTRDLLQPLRVTPGTDFNSRFGNYRHADFVGIPYGSKVGARSGRGFVHLLRPTPELWTSALPHRTQIVYLADIAFISAQLNIQRGSRVIEAGTGSASFSHSVIRSVGSAGHLWSYEFHEARAAKARDEFTRHGLLDVVTLAHRNVCKDGFTVTDTADSLFLDIPAPWDAIEHAKKALRKDCITRICCFSPCMEQVLRTVSALNDAGFTDITMYETLLRPHDLAQIPALPSIDAAADKLKHAERRREDKRLLQIAQGQRTKRKRQPDDEELSPKRAKTEEISVKSDEIPPDLPPPNNKFSVSKVMSEVRGHTSYLTFACLLPDISLISSAPHP